MSEATSANANDASLHFLEQIGEVCVKNVSVAINGV